MSNIKVLSTSSEPTITVPLSDRDWRLIAAALDSRRTQLVAAGMFHVAAMYDGPFARLTGELEARGVHDAYMGV